MKKIFSVCLWGKIKMYTFGAIKNADLCKKYYPDFEYWIYIHKSVPKNIIEELKKRDNVRIIFKKDNINICAPMTWRFESIDHPDVELMICRDVDTRILEREVLATNNWIESGKIFHIMRDHPHHKVLINGGMFGSRKIPNFNWTDEKKNIKQLGPKNYDNYFLKNKVYPIIKDKCMIHANFYRIEKDCLYFPIKYDSSFNFVGEHVYEKDNTHPYQKKLLIRVVKKLRKQNINI